MNGLGRRKFLIAGGVLAGGLALGIRPFTGAAAALPASNPGVPWGPDAPQGFELSAWIAIRPDNTVIVRVPTPEIGNGAMTQAAMNVAEELDCAWSDVRVEFASIQRDYLEQGVYASGSLPFFGGHGTDHTRMAHALQLGASARERLKAAAAARWQVPASEVVAEQGLLLHRGSGRRLTYGDVDLARTERFGVCHDFPYAPIAALRVPPAAAAKRAEVLATDWR